MTILIKLATLLAFLTGCAQSRPASQRFESKAAYPVTSRIVQRPCEEIPEIITDLVPQGGSYILFEQIQPAVDQTCAAPGAVRLVIETSAANLEPGQECTVRVRLEGAGEGATYQVELVVPPELTLSDSSTFVLCVGEEKSLRLVSHSRTMTRILARIRRFRKEGSK